MNKTTDYFRLKVNNNRKLINGKHNPYGEVFSIDFLIPEIMNAFNQILRSNVYESSYTKEEIEYRLELKKELRHALHQCAYGDSKAKIYVKDYIKEILMSKYGVNENNINSLIPFIESYNLTAEDKFDILLYHLQKRHQSKALEYLIESNHFDLPRTNENGDTYYEIDEKMIQLAYEKGYQHLDFNDQLEIVTQRVYQRYKGNGVIDTIRDMKIDGVSAGVSGIPEDFEMNEMDFPMNRK